MTNERPTPPSRSGRTETWRHERMVQRVPAHLGETEPNAVSPWVMLAGIALLILIVCAVLFIVLGGGSRLGLGGTSTTPTQTRPPSNTTPAVTIIPVTLPAPPSATPGPTAATVKYKVKAGDSLIEIAARYKTSVQAIRIANNLKDDTIRIGDELIIPLPTPIPPPGSAATPTPQSFQSPSNSAAPAATSGVIHYTVKRGDTLILIATLYGTSVDAIRAYNKLDSDLLSIGQELDVPSAGWTQTITEVPVANVTPLPTAPFVYAAPNLMLPSNNATFRGKNDTPILAWTSPATLKPNEFYIVHLDYTWNNERNSIVHQVKQGNSLRLDTSDYPGANFDGTAFSWYVVVVSQTAAKAPGQSAQMLASSPTSPIWNFLWY